MAEDALDHARKLLGDSGYPLEMKVARSLRRQGFAVDQAVIYVDIKTDALREADIVARSGQVSRSYEAPGRVELRLVIECKHTPGRPWIMFIGDTLFRESSEHFRCLDIIGPREAPLREARAADDMPVISHVGRVAYSVKAPGQKEKDDAFAALQQVKSAVLGVIRDLPAPDEGDYIEPAVIVVVPVVVIDSPLFECELGGRDEPALTPVDRGLVMTRLRSEDRLQTVWIVTANGLDDFVILARTTVANMAIA